MFAKIEQFNDIYHNPSQRGRVKDKLTDGTHPWQNPKCVVASLCNDASGIVNQKGCTNFFFKKKVGKEMRGKERKGGDGHFNASFLASHPQAKHIPLLLAKHKKITTQKRRGET